VKIIFTDQESLKEQQENLRATLTGNGYLLRFIHQVLRNKEKQNSNSDETIISAVVLPYI
jgi:hypothetical protein